MSTRTIPRLVLVAVVALAAAACGGGDDEGAGGTAADATTTTDRSGRSSGDRSTSGDDDASTEAGDTEPSETDRAAEAARQAEVRAAERCASVVRALGEARSSITTAFRGGADFDGVAAFFAGFDAPSGVAGAFDTVADVHRELGRIIADAGVDFSNPEDLNRPEAGEAINAVTMLIGSPRYNDPMGAVERYTMEGCPA